jgi:hypothetical protein
MASSSRVNRWTCLSTQVGLTIHLPPSEIQKESEATKEQRLAALEELMRMAKPNPSGHMTRDELHER